MYKIIATIVNCMQYIYAAWNCAWWNHHIESARMHDARMSRLDPEWREKA